MTEKQKKGKSRLAKSSITQDAPRVTIILLAMWLLTGLYVGAASWTKINYDSLLTKAENARAQVNCDDPAHEWLQYEGDLYCVIEDVYVVQQLELMGNLFLNWIFYLPDPLPLVLSAFAFGALGSLVRILRNWLNKKYLPVAGAIPMMPLMGGVTALMLLGISYIFPSLFSDKNILLKPEVQPFLSLFAGVFSDHLQRWFQIVINKNFNRPLA